MRRLSRSSRRELPVVLDPDPLLGVGAPVGLPRRLPRRGPLSPLDWSSPGEMSDMRGLHCFLHGVLPPLARRSTSYCAPRCILKSLEQRADERTRTAFSLITSDNSGVAGVCTDLQIPH